MMLTLVPSQSTAMRDPWSRKSLHKPLGRTKVLPKLQVGSSPGPNSAFVGSVFSTPLLWLVLFKKWYYYSCTYPSAHTLQCGASCLQPAFEEKLCFAPLELGCGPLFFLWRFPGIFWKQKDLLSHLGLKCSQPNSQLPPMPSLL